MAGSRIPSNDAIMSLGICTKSKISKDWQYIVLGLVMTESVDMTLTPKLHKTVSGSESGVQ